MSWLDRLRGRREPERSPGGSRVYRHTEPAEPGVSGGDAGLIEAVAAHIERHIGEPETVWHQMVSAYVHVDIHLVPPADERPCTTLVTTGMSERAMAAPKPEWSRAELVMALPPDWPTDQESCADERHYWPFRLLQQLAALPHQFDTWLWSRHTIPNGDPPAPYAEGTPYCCAMLDIPLLTGEDFVEMSCGEHSVVFLGVYPLHEAEMRLKLEAGAEELERRFDAAGVTELLQPDRPSVA